MGKKEVLVTAAVDGSPSGDPDVWSSCVRAASGGQTDWSDVVGEGDWRGELQQAYVVVLCLAVVVGMVDDFGHAARHLIAVQLLLEAPAQVYGDTRYAGSEGKDTTYNS